MCVSVTAAVVMPSGKTAYPKIEDNRDGTVTVRYQPTETGLHELHVKYNNESIEGNRGDLILPSTGYFGYRGICC